MRHKVPTRKRCWIDIQQRFLFAFPVLHRCISSSSALIPHRISSRIFRSYFSLDYQRIEASKTLAARRARPLNSPFADHVVGVKNLE
ncbi:hypothetical protein [Paraburkholderia saeva]|uniref:hypothetical protein n=1 Tax=Paraburkholderia saeva TaxID=2777537 RepID=UPI001E31AA25|nr:hypothetical protein [Paraburkholderia saeva]